MAGIIFDAGAIAHFASFLYRNEYAVQDVEPPIDGQQLSTLANCSSNSASIRSTAIRILSSLLHSEMLDRPQRVYALQ